MARRKDHSPDELRQHIRQAALALLEEGGLGHLTARRIAERIGYAPGTLYNLYPDMEGLILDVNRATLARLADFCLEHIGQMPMNHARICALAQAYFDFAHAHCVAWQLLFRPVQDRIWPEDYQKDLHELFDMLADNLRQCWGLDRNAAPAQAHLFWSSLHGVTMLALDGRLALAGAADPRQLATTLADALYHNNMRDKK